MKKGIISYTHSNNLGDYIQALAAEEYLRGELMHFDRDSLHQDPGEPYQLLVNGWFMEQPTHWPPHPHFIPLFISYHLNPTVEKEMLTPAGVSTFAVTSLLVAAIIIPKTHSLKKELKPIFLLVLLLAYLKRK